MNRKKGDVVTKVLSTDEFKAGSDEFKIMNVKYVRESNIEIGEEPDLQILGVNITFKDKII